MAQLVWQAAHKALEVGELQGSPHLLVRVAVEGVQVHPQRPREQHGVLGATERGIRVRAESRGCGYECAWVVDVMCVWGCYHLGDDGDPGSEVMEADVSDVDPVDVDLSLRRLQDAENPQGQRRLPSSGPSHAAHLQGAGRGRGPSKVELDE